MFGFKSKSGNDTSDITGSSYDENEFRPAELTPDTPNGLTTQRSPRTLSIVSDDIIEALNDEAKYVLVPRYGFPDPEDHEILRQEMLWKLRVTDKINAEIKVWHDLLHSKSNNRIKQYKPIIRKYGIPACYRPKVWLEIRGVDKKLKENEGYYHSILDVHKNTPCVSAEQITLDLHRTFPQHPLFFESDDENSGRNKMQRILTAYSWRNPHVSYCQSLNYIVGILLMHLNEEQAFWMLVSILEEILPANFYNPQLKGVRVDTHVLEELVKERLPRLYQHFMNTGIEVQTFATGWLMRLFVDIFPIETTLRLWDLMFFEGSKIMFRAVLSYLKLHESSILELKHMGEMLHFLNGAPMKEFDYHTLIKTCFSFYNLKREDVDTLRQKCTTVVEEEIRELEKRREAARQRLEAMRKQQAETAVVEDTSTSS